MAAWLCQANWGKWKRILEEVAGGKLSSLFKQANKSGALFQISQAQIYLVQYNNTTQHHLTQPYQERQKWVKRKWKK